MLQTQLKAIPPPEINRPCTASYTDVMRETKTKASIDAAVISLTTEIQCAIRLNASPKPKPPIENNMPWWSTTLLSLRQTLRRAKRNHFKKKNEESNAALKSPKRGYQNDIRLAKIKSWNLMNESPNKDNVAALRQLKTMNEVQEIGFPPVLVTEDSTISDQPTILQLCARHFFPAEEKIQQKTTK